VTGPGAQFQQGDDFVAARLSIEIPTEGIANLRELTQEMERFRVGAEAAARAQEDFNNYLRASAEEGDRFISTMNSLMAAMQRSAELQERLATGSSTAGGTAVPQGYVDPFSSAEAGRGRTPVSAMEAQGQLDALSRSDPRTYLNMQAQRGGLRPGDLPSGRPDESQIAATAERVNAREAENMRRHRENPAAAPSGGLSEMLGGVNAGVGLAQQVVSEMGPGGSHAGMMGLAASGLRRISAAAPGGAEGGALAGLMKGAGVAGLAATGLLAGYGLTQKVGETMQGYANMGSIRGEGMAAGFSQEMAVRTMAMNPFLTTEQSRQIIQSALSEGYTGKQFDSVTQFMATNLRDMNMQVADSVELLRKNVNEGGQSIAELGVSMSVLKGLSQDGARSLPELLAGFKATSGAMINAGVSGPQAAQAAMVAGQVWGDDQSLKGMFETAQQIASSNSTSMSIMTALGPGAMPGALPGTQFARMADGGNQATFDALRTIAQRSWKMGRGDAENAARLFQIQLGRLLPGHPATQSMTTAKKMMMALLNGENPLAEAEQAVEEEKQEAITPRGKGVIEQVGGFFGGIVQGMFLRPVAAARAAGSAIADATTGNWQGASVYNEKFRKTMDSAERNMDPFAMKMPALKAIEDEYGMRGYEVLDSSGEVVKFNKANREQMEKLSSGEYKWRPKGASGEGHTVKETAGITGEQLREFAKASQQNVSGSVTIGLTPEASRMLQVQGGTNVVRLTPHEEKANSGFGGATPNNAPPGESALARGRNGW